MSDASKPEKRSGAPESPASNETFLKRTKRPGKIGLANEVRPGLGTRAKTGADNAVPTNETPHDADPMGRNAPLPPAKPKPEPREQSPDSQDHREERDTGVSGHTSGD